MKTCVHFTGHMRTFARCLATIHWQVLRHFPNPTFIVSTVRDADVGSIDNLRRIFPQARIEVDIVDAQPELPIPLAPVAADWTVGRMYSHEPYAISVHPQAILRQLWQLNRTWEFMLKVGIKAEDFDVYLRIRPDLWIKSFDKPPLQPRWDVSMTDRLVMSQQPHVMVNPKDALTPWWGRFGGINDRFAILGSKAAEAYFATYAKIPELIAAGCPLHPESLVKASLELAGCTIDDTLRVEFAKLYGNENPKLVGSFRDPEITPIDIAHLGAKR